MTVAQLILGDMDVPLLVLGVVILLGVDGARWTRIRGIYLAGGGHLLIDVAGGQLLVRLMLLVCLLLLVLLLLLLLLLVMRMHGTLEVIAGNWSLLITRLLLLLLLLLVGTQNRRGGIGGRGGITMPPIFTGCLAKTGHFGIVGRYVGVLAHVPANEQIKTNRVETPKNTRLLLGLFITIFL